METNNYGRILCVCLSLFILMVARQARAVLGEPAESVVTDSKTLSAVQRATTSRNGYTVQEIVTDANRVREYISPSGIVFAIAWNGLTQPDLTHLLGSFAGDYRQALQHTQRTAGHRHIRVNASKVVVEKWGHMRNMQGRAYVPALLPQGVSVDEIK